MTCFLAREERKNLREARELGALLAPEFDLKVEVQSKRDPEFPYTIKFRDGTWNRYRCASALLRALREIDSRFAHRLYDGKHAGGTLVAQ